MLKVAMAVAKAGTLAWAAVHRGAQDQDAGPQQQPAHATHAEELDWNGSEKAEKYGYKAEASSEGSKRMMRLCRKETVRECVKTWVSEWPKVGSTHGSIYNIHPGEKMRRACCSNERVARGSQVSVRI